MVTLHFFSLESLIYVTKNLKNMKKLTKNQKILLKIGAGVAIVIVGYAAYKYIKLPKYKDIGNLLKDPSPVPLKSGNIYFWDKFLNYPEDSIPGKDNYLGWISGFCNVEEEIKFNQGLIDGTGFIYAGDLKVNPKNFTHLYKDHFIDGLFYMKDGEIRRCILVQKLGIFKAFSIGAKAILGYIPVIGK